MVRCLVIASLLAAAIPARADTDADAWELLQGGIRQYQAGDLVRARALLMQARGLVPDRVPTIHRWLGLTEAKLGHCADAVVELERFLASSPSETETGEVIAVRDQCKSALAALTSIRVESSPPGADVRIDPDDDPKKPALGVTPVSLEGIPPGDHLVAVYRAGYKTATRIVTLATGRVTRVELTLVPLAPQTTTPVIVAPGLVAAPKAVWKRTWFWPTVIGAAVVVGVAVGVGVGVGTQTRSYPTLMFQ